MSEFVAGFAGRNQGVAQALQAAFALPEGFAPADLRDRAYRGPVSFAPQGGEPRHFSPADPSGNPTEGWDPFTATQETTSGFADPVAAARATGFAEGKAAARAEIDSGETRDQALLAELIAALRAEGRVDRERIARQLRQTVLFLTGKLVGEVGVAPALFAARIDVAADLLADAAESAMLRVHPDDIAMLDGALPKTVFAVGDAAVARGSFVLESASTIVEDGPELWLEQLAQAIERIAVPSPSTGS
ncbi:MAG: FliH/SctL family protein [Sphingomonas sp.]